MIFLSPGQSAEYAAIILLHLFFTEFNSLIRVPFFCDLKRGKFAENQSMELLTLPDKNRTRIIPID